MKLILLHDEQNLKTYILQPITLDGVHPSTYSGVRSFRLRPAFARLRRDKSHALILTLSL